MNPWGTHLGSEEYPPDAEAIEKAASLEEIDDYYKPMVRYFGVDPAKMDLTKFREVFNPYAYGFPTEITVTQDGNATAAKHYTMGRVAVELAYVMPDRKTAYISDDGTNVGLFKFVADKADDLTSGTLYGSKWVQTSAENGGAATLEWIDLGHATDAQIAEMIAKKPKFSDIFEVAELGADGSCADGFAPSNAEAVQQCLKVKDGMEAAASRLETRRYASMKGATTEFRKMEGITHNPEAGVLYVAMSEVAKGMTTGDKGDLPGRDAIQLQKNACGTVYELALDQDYSATSMKALISASPLAVSPVFAVMMYVPAWPAFVMNRLPPSMTQAPPSGPSSRRAVVLVPPASEPAPGSVRPYAPMTSPDASGRSQRSFCASVPAIMSGPQPSDVCAATMIPSEPHTRLISSTAMA